MPAIDPAVSDRNTQPADKPEELDDSVLMSRIARDKDSGSFQLLLKRHMSNLMNVAYRMGFSTDDAEDIVQETMVRVWRKAETWRENDGASVKSWITTIAYNLCIDRKRKIARTHEVQGLDLGQFSGQSNTESTIAQNQTMQIVRDALKKLPERQRAALVLCHYHGYSQSEAADIIGTSVKGIEGLLVRGKAAMKTLLAKHKEVLS